MRFLPVLFAAFCMSNALAAPVQKSAPVSCAAGYADFSVKPLDCVGAVRGNLMQGFSPDQFKALKAQFTDDGFKPQQDWLYSKSDAAQHGVFADLGDDMSLNFDPGFMAKGLFVIGLKQANYYSLYLFDGGSAGIQSLNFNVRGVVNKQLNDLSHAVYFGPSLQTAPPVRPAGGGSAPPRPQPVPAPGALWLAATGLGLLALRRRAR
jgi:hypothetical protein